MGAVVIPNNLPVGYRFHPTDEEYIDHYLKNRVRGLVDRPCIIPDVDICRWDPWELPLRFRGESIIRLDDKAQEWWFFCQQTPQHPKRSSPSGYWKKTGKDRNVKPRDSNRPIGFKKTLVFHKGRSNNGVKTNWVIHEYHQLSEDLNRNYVLCRIKLKRDEKVDNSTTELEQGAHNSVGLDSGLHQPDHEGSFPMIQAWVGETLNSPRLPTIQEESQVPVALPDLLQLPQPPLQPQNNSFPFNIYQLMDNESQFFMDFSLENGLHGESNQWEPLFQISEDDEDGGLFQVSEDDEDVGDMDFSLDNGFPEESNQWESLFQISEDDEDFSLFQVSEDDEDFSLFQVSEDDEDFSLFQVSEDDEDVGDMDFSLDNGFPVESNQWESLFQISEDEEDVGDVQISDYFDGDIFDGDQMQTQRGQASNSQMEHPVLMENRRTRTIDSFHGVFSLEEKKGTVENKFNGSLVVSQKCIRRPVAMEIRGHVLPIVTAAKNNKPKGASLTEMAAIAKHSKMRESPRIYSNEEQRLAKVKKEENASRNIKSEGIFLDDSAATTKALEYKEHGSASNSPKKTNSKTKHARENSYSVTALTRPTKENTKYSANSPQPNLVNLLVGIFLLFAVTCQVFRF